VKDVFESRLKRLVCAGSSLATAQAEIGDWWVHYYFGLPVGAGGSTVPPAAPGPTLVPGPGGPPSSLAVRIESAPGSVVRGSLTTVSADTAPRLTSPDRSVPTELLHGRGPRL
jgi:hypothetical protein